MFSLQTFMTVQPIEEIEILGYSSNVDLGSVTVNRRNARISRPDSGYDSEKRILRLKRPRDGFVPLNDALAVFTVEWNNA